MKKVFLLTFTYLVLITSAAYGQTTVDATEATEALRNTVNKVLPGNLNIDSFESDGTGANCEVSAYVNLTGGKRMKLDATFNAAEDNNSIAVTGTLTNVTIEQLLRGIGAESTNLPSNFNNSVVDVLTMTINPITEQLTASMTTSLGQMEMSGTKGKGHMIGIRPNNLGNMLGHQGINSALSGFTLIYSSHISEEDSSVELLTGVKAQNGLNLYWTGSLPGPLKDRLGLLGIPGINGEKTFVCTESLTEQVSLPTLSFPLGGVGFSVLDFKEIALELDPSNASIGLTGEITLDFGGGFPKLNFTPGLVANISTGAVTGEISCPGWEKAFGIDGVDITRFFVGFESENGPPVAYVGGSANIFGLAGTIEVSSSNGLLGMSGEMDNKINFDNFFIFEGNDGGGPSFEMKMSGSGLPALQINGKAKVLGLAKASANITISPSGVEFKQSANIAGLVTSLTAKANSLLAFNNPNLEVTATITNDLTDKIINEAEKHLDDVTASIVETALSSLEIDKMEFTTSLNGFDDANVRVEVKASIFGENTSFSISLDLDNIVEAIALKIINDFGGSILAGLEDAVEAIEDAVKATLDFAGDVGGAIKDLVFGKKSEPYYYTPPSNGVRKVERIPQGAALYKVSLSMTPTVIKDGDSSPDKLEIYGEISIEPRKMSMHDDLFGEISIEPVLSMNLGANEWLFHRSLWQYEQMELQDSYNESKYFFTNYSAVDGIADNSVFFLSIDLGENDEGSDNDDVFNIVVNEEISVENLAVGQSATYDYYVDEKDSNPSQLKITITVARLFVNPLTQVPMYVKALDGSKILGTSREGSLALENKDDESGRQKWHFNALNDGSYHIKVSDGTNIGETFLSGNQAGQVFLNSEDDRSGYQRWEINKLVSNGEYSIKMVGALDSEKKYLSRNGKDEIVLVSNMNPQNGRGKWVISGSPTCNDGIQNQGEEGVDCGSPCQVCLTCDDGIQNQGETAIDCGGPNCSACPGELGGELEGGIIAEDYGDNNKLVCELNPSFKSNWEDAKRRCATYTGGGYTGWRLPSMNELDLIYANAYKKGNNDFNLDVGYWSRESSGYTIINHARSLDFTTPVGYVDTHTELDLYCCCVRTSQNIPQESLGGILVGDLIVASTDVALVNWEDAMNTTGEYNGGGFTNWRLPTSSEVGQIKEEMYDRGLGNFNTLNNTFYWGTEQVGANNIFQGVPIELSTQRIVTLDPAGSSKGIVRPVRNLIARPATCHDGIKNQGETSTDCGGPNCSPCPTCHDGIQNQGERAVDCGGSKCSPCDISVGKPFRGGILAYLDNYNISGLIISSNSLGTLNWDVANSASDSYSVDGYDDWYIPSINELRSMQAVIPYLNIDGHMQCWSSDKTGTYWVNKWDNLYGVSSVSTLTVNDIQNLYVVRAFDLSLTCEDGIRNQGETAVDCGGPNCSPCPTCNDGVQNQGEEAVDCGGPNCEPCALTLGMEYEGGIIFHLDETGQRGLVCSPSNITSARLTQSNSICEAYEVEGYADWRLPSRDDLIKMYTNLHKKGKGNFSPSTYWSSTPNTMKLHGKTGAWVKNMGTEENGREFPYDSYHKIRAVRTFGGDRDLCNDFIQNQGEKGVDCGGPCKPCNLAIGDLYEDGIIFYLDETGQNGKVCTTESLKESKSAVVKTTCESYTSEGGYSDWYAPSRTELNQMYTSLYKTPFINISEKVWSAKTGNDKVNWTKSFNDSGLEAEGFESWSHEIYAVRAFGQIPTCYDGIQNQGETAIDCGGQNCAPCDLIATENPNMPEYKYGVNNKILGVGTDYKLWTRATINSAWEEVPNSGTIINMLSVVQLQDETFLGVGTDNNLWTRETLSSAWIKVPNAYGFLCATQLRDGSILGVGIDNKLWTRATLTSNGSQVANTSGFQWVSLMNDGRILCIKDDRLYIKETPNSDLVPGPNHLTVSIRSVTQLEDGTLTALGKNDKRLWKHEGSGWVLQDENNPYGKFIGVSTYKPTPQIGAPYAGGIVFYLAKPGEDLNGDGIPDKGLIAAPSDQSSGIKWSLNTGTIPNLEAVTSGLPLSNDDLKIGNGAVNTTTIVQDYNNSKGEAAKFCDDLVLGGFSNWFLPSIGELTLMYNAIGNGAIGLNKNIGQFEGLYWSSTEQASYGAWRLRFSNGEQWSNNKTATNNKVRAVRVF